MDTTGRMILLLMVLLLFVISQSEIGKKIILMLLWN